MLLVVAKGRHPKALALVLNLVAEGESACECVLVFVCVRVCLCVSVCVCVCVSAHIQASSHRPASAQMQTRADKKTANPQSQRGGHGQQL